MALSAGFIKLHRRLLNWQWYGDAAVKSVFIHLLLTANYKETEWNGIELQPGQLVTSIRKLSEELRHTKRHTRTARARLKSTHKTATKTTNRFSVITVVNRANISLSVIRATHRMTHKTAIKRHTKSQKTTHKTTTV